MTVIIVSSLEDTASTTIKESLLQQTPWQTINEFQNNPVYRHTTDQDIYLITITDSTIHHEHLDQEITQTLHITPTQLIFISRHRSQLGEPSLTVHPIGNYGLAEFGGRPHTLVPTAPRLMTHLLRLIKKNLQNTTLTHHVCYEVTHHGPSLETPTFYTEVGSTETEWKKQEPAHVIAQSLLELLTTYRHEKDLPKNIPVLVGIGGGHYAPRFTELTFQKNIAFGHMIPSYHIEGGNITPEMIQKTMDATPNVQGIYLHKKALKKSQITEYKHWCKDLDIPLVSSKELPDLT
ncbi:MAG: D-aminoacyl-tRNA deacylase [Methanobacteriota archaeon]